MTRGAQLLATDASQQHDPVAGFAPLDLYQRREKIFTRVVEGRFQRLRLYSGWPLLLGYLLLPWLDWGDRQAVLFDIGSRQFFIFGATFWPQDFMLLAWLLIIAAFALFTVTSVIGRIWCGYTCPQTIWTAIFMWVEQLTEGPRHARIRLDAAPWSVAKAGKRGAKHALWLGWAFVTGFTFVGYFTPIRVLAVDIATLQVAATSAMWMAFFTLATYVNAGWLREQVCIYMCPYARFQSAMFDDNTLIVSYDAARGEPRGARKRHSHPEQLGDCIDCELCVQVCPTGIDIRAGLQYQCIGCAHCVDACDDVMRRVGYAPGLIRYTAGNALRNEPVRVLRPRVLGYAGALVVMCTLFVIALVGRSLLGIEVIRDRGDLFHVDRGGVRNDYTLKIANKTQQGQTYSLSLPGAPRGMEFDGPREVEVDAGEVANVSVSLAADPAALDASVVNVRFEVCDAQRHCVTQTNRFFGPQS